MKNRSLVHQVSELKETVDPSGTFDDRAFEGRWQLVHEKCGEETSAKEIDELVSEASPSKFGGSLTFKDGKYSQELIGSPICKKDSPRFLEDKTYCGQDLQTDGKYYFHEQGTVGFRGKEIKWDSTESIRLVAALGLDGYTDLKWRKKGGLLILRQPPNDHFHPCKGKPFWRYYIRFLSS
ncbi:MAG: hypothetical protein AB7O96_03585 [Pseudobdellovibrionaceae bacterium]